HGMNASQATESPAKPPAIAFDPWVGVRPPSTHRIIAGTWHHSPREAAGREGRGRSTEVRSGSMDVDHRSIEMRDGDPPAARSGRPAIVGSAVSMAAVALVAAVPDSPLQPVLPRGVAPSGPFRWAAGAL